MREVEDKISVLKTAKFTDFIKPISAFITFEEEDAYLFALEFKEHLTKPARDQLLNEDLYFEKATEPTNIIWENRHLTTKERFKRALKVTLIIIVLICISFTIIFYCKSYSIKVGDKYPAVDCTVIKSAYTRLEKWAA
jgi:hypothetical protein